MDGRILAFGALGAMAAWRAFSVNPHECSRGNANVVSSSGFHRTALVRSDVSAPLRHLQNFAPELLRGRILDFGSGHGADAKALGASAYDPHHPDPAIRKIPLGAFDAVLMMYVLNVLPENDRRKTLKIAAGKVGPGGHLVLAVRSRADVERVASDWKKHGDGWAIFDTDGTLARFQRGYTLADLESQVRPWLGDDFRVKSVPSISGGAVLLVLERVK